METLKEFHIINSWIGLLHTLCAIIAMLFGTLVLLNKKGTQKHKRLGYIYLINMLLLNGTAFGIYNFNGISMFHFFAIISLISIGMGILPTIKKRENWLKRHFIL